MCKTYKTSTIRVNYNYTIYHPIHLDKFPVSKNKIPNRELEQFVTSVRVSLSNVGTCMKIRKRKRK